MVRRSLLKRKELELTAKLHCFTTAEDKETARMFARRKGISLMVYQHLALVAYNEANAKKFEEMGMEVAA